MLVAVSVDMEGASQLVDVREIFGCFPEYWATGKPALEADVAAACEGLLSGGATELAILDNHGGNTVNVSPESVPSGARLESWNVFDLHEHGVDAMFQVGYHARGGVEGFLSHTYLPGLRLRVDGELISESHGRAWAGGVPLLGIVGNDLHERTLGSLAGLPYLVVQESVARRTMRPVFEDADAGLRAIRSFAETCIGSAGSVAAPVGPTGFRFEASMPNGHEVGGQMAAAGWERVADVEFAIELETWGDTRAPLAAAMDAALVPYLPYWLGGFASGSEAAAADRQRVDDLATIFDAWAASSEPEWFAEAADPFAPGVRERLG
jgi:D-aminopeptidase